MTIRRKECQSGRSIRCRPWRSWFRQQHFWHTAVAAVLLSFILPVSGLEPVYGAGADSTAQETVVSFPVKEGSREIKTELTGTIEVDLISVAMPADGFDFQVDPGSPFDAVSNPGGQIKCPGPESLKVSNHSAVPVRLEIAKVEPVKKEDIHFTDGYTGGPAQTFRLVDRISEVRDSGTAILVLGRENKAYQSDADFEQYAICPGKEGILIADLGVGESAGLQLYGKAAADFYGEYHFTVRPTLKISAVRAH